MPVIKATPSLRNIGETLGMPSNMKLSSVCTSSKLCKFAKNKPVSSQTCEYGLSIPLIRGTDTLNAFTMSISTYESTYSWTYLSRTSPYHLGDFVDSNGGQDDYPVQEDTEGGSCFTSSWESQITESDKKKAIPGGYVELEQALSRQHIDVDAHYTVDGLLSIRDFTFEPAGLSAGTRFYLGVVGYFEDTEGSQGSLVAYRSAPDEISYNTVLSVTGPQTIWKTSTIRFDNPRCMRAYPVLFVQEFSEWTTTLGSYGGTIIPIDGKVVKVV